MAFDLFLVSSRSIPTGVASGAGDCGHTSERSTGSSDVIIANNKSYNDISNVHSVRLFIQVCQFLLSLCSLNYEFSHLFSKTSMKSILT